jgi:hypothetical protein
MTTPQTPRQAASLDDPRVRVLLGGTPPEELRKKPVPLTAEFRERARILTRRRGLVSAHSKTILGPLHQLVSANPESLVAQKALGELRPVDPPPRVKPVRPSVGSHIRSGSVLALRFPPYDDVWTDGTGFVDSGTNLEGATLNDWGEGQANFDDGTFSVKAEVNWNANWVWGGAGVAVWFQPIADRTLVRFAADAPGEGNWDDSSWGWTAHSNAQLGVLIESWGPQGDYQLEVDRRIPLWADGTGWWEEHSDWPSPWFPNDTYFFAYLSRWYRVLTWTEAWCDAEGYGSFGSSANNNLAFQSYFTVFEQFT